MVASIGTHALGSVAAIAGLDRVSRVSHHESQQVMPQPIMHSHFFRPRRSLRILSQLSSPSILTLLSVPSSPDHTKSGLGSLVPRSQLKTDSVTLQLDCFETFPFPEGWDTHSDLEAAGKEYFQFRGELMIRNNEGLTKTYNRFHDPDERSPEIAELRKLHVAMDRTVLDAYGWVDISTDCEFLLDYEIDEGWGKKKKPWRYRWPDGVRDEVLARLMALNGKRALEERLAGRNSQLTKATS